MPAGSSVPAVSSVTAVSAVASVLAGAESPVAGGPASEGSVRAGPLVPAVLAEAESAVPDGTLVVRGDGAVVGSGLVLVLHHGALDWVGRGHVELGEHDQALARRVLRVARRQRQVGGVGTVVASTAPSDGPTTVEP